MPLAPADDQGTQLYYQDSGAPPGIAVYTTLILVHGTLFHGATYSPMLSFAAKHNIRLVALNLRGYPKSTPFSEEEAAIAQSGDYPSLDAFIAARGLEVASFVAWFIQEHALPRLSTTITLDGTESIHGGVSLLGWSYGTAIMLSFLAHADRVSQETREFLDGYLRTCILHDPPALALGLPGPDLKYAYSPFRDPTLTAQEMSDGFGIWVSSYFQYSPHILAALDTSDDLHALLVDFSTHYKAVADPPHRRPTVLRMSPEQLQGCADSHGALRSHLPILAADPSIYSANLRAALMEPKAWPRLRVVYAWCDMTVADCVYGTAQFAKMQREAWPATGRQVEMLRMRGANHFVHWDDPERALQDLAGVI